MKHIHKITDFIAPRQSQYLVNRRIGIMQTIPKTLIFLDGKNRKALSCAHSIFSCCLPNVTTARWKVVVRRSHTTS